MPDRNVTKQWRLIAKALDRFLSVLPEWVQNVLQQLERSIDKAHNFSKGKFTPKMMGTLAGQIVASSDLFLKKINPRKRHHLVLKSA